MQPWFSVHGVSAKYLNMESLQCCYPGMSGRFPLDPRILAMGRVCFQTCEVPFQAQAESMSSSFPSLPCPPLPQEAMPEEQWALAYFPPTTAVALHKSSLLLSMRKIPCLIGG